MDLSLEAHRIVVENVRSRSDLAALCRVSKTFQQIAERALYNTVFMHDVEITRLLCRTLAQQPRVANQVDAFTIALSEVSTSDDSSYEEEDADIEDTLDRTHFPSGNKVTTQRPASPGTLPDDYWEGVSRALRNTQHLRYLNIYITNHFETSNTWILNGCTFRLRSLHCDLNWDQNLVAFLNTQTEIEDLYIADFKDSTTNVHPAESIASPVSSDASSTPHPPPDSPTLSHRTPTPIPVISESESISLHLSPEAIPRLTTLECTFTEAANHLVPSRPVAQLKTCLSQSMLSEKRIELRVFVDNAALSSNRGGLASLDLADSDYTADFSLEILEALTQNVPGLLALKYLGTLVLPVDGSKVRTNKYLLDCRSQSFLIRGLDSMAF